MASPNKDKKQQFKYNTTPFGAGNGVVNGYGTLGPNYGIPQKTK